MPKELCLWIYFWGNSWRRLVATRQAVQEYCDSSDFLVALICVYASFQMSFHVVFLLQYPMLESFLTWNFLCREEQRLTHSSSLNSISFLPTLESLLRTHVTRLHSHLSTWEDFKGPETRCHMQDCLKYQEVSLKALWACKMEVKVSKLVSYLAKEDKTSCCVW